MPAAWPYLIGELLRLQNGARLAAEIAAGLRAGQAFADRLHPRQARRRRRRLQRPDRVDAAAAAAAGHGRLGPLQARSPGRPCAGRRSAGYQCRAVGNHRTAGRGIFQRLERGRASARAPCSWSATSSRRSTASRAPTRKRFIEAREDIQAPRGGDEHGGDDLFSYRRSAQEFRDLSIAASFRSAQPVLDVVDAVIDTVGPAAMALDEAPPPHARTTRTGPAWSSCGSRSRSRNRPTTATRAKSAGSAMRDRKYAAGAGRTNQAMVEEAPVLASTGRPLDAGRHPGPGSQPRRARRR